MTYHQVSAAHHGTSHDRRCDPPVKRRPVHSLLPVALTVLPWLLIAVPCAQALRPVRGLLSGVTLSTSEQATFAERNRTLVLRNVGIPEAASILSIQDRALSDDDEDVVIAVSTTFDLAVPTGQTRTLLEPIIARFEDIGFRRVLEPPAGPRASRTRAVVLKRRGVTAALEAGDESASIEVSRDW